MKIKLNTVSLTIWKLGYFLESLTCEEEKAKDHDRGVAEVEEC